LWLKACLPSGMSVSSEPLLDVAVFVCAEM
jgi:hypothetical protein